MFKSQFGLAPDVAETAVENVIMPWYEANGWRTYVLLEADDLYVLQNGPPVKLKRHLALVRGSLLSE